VFERRNRISTHYSSIEHGSSTAIPPSEDEALSAAERGAAIGLLEWHLVASSLAAIVAGVAIAAAEGITPREIVTEDLRLIFCAAAFDASNGLTALLYRAKRELIRTGHWARTPDAINGVVTGWTDEALVDLATTYSRREPRTRECCRAIVALRSLTPAPYDLAEIGCLSGVRVGLALLALSRFSGIPLPWLHRDFTRICGEVDAVRAAFTATDEPEDDTPPIVINAPAGGMR
jgi:hypothetical protein